MAVSRLKAKSLCTTAEFALVDASAPKKIVALSAAQLRLKVIRARRLLDKWRDNTKNQRRAAPSKISGGDTAARSAEKSRLFVEVLQRFEKQLAKTEGESRGAAALRKESPRKTRNRHHRITRATVRRKLADARLGYSDKS